jgi:uncharacterized membrane protein
MPEMSNQTRRRTSPDDQPTAPAATASKLPPRQAQKNVQTITRLEEKTRHNRSVAVRLADGVSHLAGSPSFILCHVFWFGMWVLVNLRVLPIVTAFDPFPFNFLTLVVSLEAIFLSLLVLMAQNRMTKEADKRAHLDLQINMLTEQQGTLILGLLQKVCERLDIDAELDDVMQEMAEETDVHGLAEILEENLPDQK